VERFVKRPGFPASGCRVPIAAIGAATADVLRKSGLCPSLIPTDFKAEGLLATFPSNLDGTRILFPRAETARELLPAELRRRGAVVDVIVVYRTVGTEVEVLRESMNAETIDCAVFTSPSTIQFLAENLKVPLKEFFRGAAIATIGPVTANTAMEFGLNVSIVPARATIEDLVASIVSYFG
jgi:uroporphyrinogen-III synthase